MNLTRSSLQNPAGVAVGVAIVLLFGLFSLAKLPVQLLPDIERPQLGISTSWRAASPQEIESEILEAQEEVLQGLPGLEEMVAEINQGWCNVSLTFGLETDMQETLIDVISRLNRVPTLPADADPPVVRLGGGGRGGDFSRELIWFYVQLLPGNVKPIESYQKLIEDQVQPRFESVRGVAGLQLMAGAPEEVQIRFDPYRAAELGIEIPRIAALAGRADDVSGGFVDVGRRKYTLRFAGRYTPAQLEELILEWRDGRPIRLGDVAEVAVGRGDRSFATYQNGNPAMAMRIDRDNNANVLEALEAVKAVAAELDAGLLAENGLTIRPSFDASVFIHRAIALVSGNLAAGVLLAVAVLWWFLRRLKATLIVATAIPLSLAGTFIVLSAFGRSLNVISLAGLAFAVGMVLDAAIVVLENIVRLRERGAATLDAATEGTAQVWGALVASTATTVAIFLPVIFLPDVEGQLFADLALTVAIAVTLSLLVAVTILPAAASRWLAGAPPEEAHGELWDRLAGRLAAATSTTGRRAGWIAALMGVPVVVTALLLPRLDYLPPVERDAVDSILALPPGASVESVDREIARTVIDRLAPYMAGDQEPALRNYYLFTWPGNAILGARARDQKKVADLERLMREEITIALPDTQVYVFRGNLFGGFDSARSIAFHLQVKDAEALYEAGRRGLELLRERIPGATVRPLPGLEMAEPELRLHPDDQRILEVGWTRAQVAAIVRALGDGLYVGEHFDGEKRMNLILRCRDWATPEELEAVPLATPSGAVLQVGELVDLERTVGPTKLRRVDRRRTLTLQVNPPVGTSLEETIQAIKNDVAPVLLAAMPADATIRYGGSADALKNAVRNMSENFSVALLVLFLLMSALFKSMKDSLLVVLALPLATVGGVAALRLVNLVVFQPLDLLTMIGFIILLGLVVNNAILLVHQTRRAERAGMGRGAAVAQALRLRLRPIFMSTLTSIFGMLPLVLMPGTGSVIYRGLAVVIAGGMSVSTAFTLILLPSLLRLGEERTPAPDRSAGVEGLEQAA